ncbi:MAG: BspA family leucine-rich repeat surface protein, partial [Haliscomenobacter sp.]
MKLACLLKGIILLLAFGLSPRLSASPTDLVKPAVPLNPPADEFTTKWVFPAATSTITFNALTSGAVNYTWEITPSGGTGSSSFTQLSAGSVSLNISISAGDTVILRMQPTNLQRFYIENGPDFDKLREVMHWSTAAWTSMESAFEGCLYLTLTATDMPDLSNVTSMRRMFWQTYSFNQDISGWDVSNVTNMSGMFVATPFNQDIGGWDVSNVTNMGGMFYQASLFNQDLSGWDVSQVTNMQGLFWLASAFNQNLGSWDISNVTNMVWMLNNCGLDCANYSGTLKGWSEQLFVPSSIILDVNILSYGTDAAIYRSFLINTKGWTITGDVQGMSACLNLDQFTTKWVFPASATSIQFRALSAGPVFYHWEASPSGNSNYGSFSQGIPGIVTLNSLTIQAGDTVTLRMNPDNLLRFYMAYGPDTAHLTEVAHWSSVQWASMELAFAGCRRLAITALDTPDLSAATNLSFMFEGAYAFNQDISGWDVSNVTNMNALFAFATSFNQDISSWDVSNVTSMYYTFAFAGAFNQNISSWDVSN